MPVLCTAQFAKPAVRSHVLSFPSLQWQAIQKDLMADKLFAGERLSSLLLPNDHPKVLSFLADMRSRRGRKKESAQKARERLRTGEGWKACFERAQNVREYLEQEFQKKADRLHYFAWATSSGWEARQFVSLGCCVVANWTASSKVPPTELLLDTFQSLWTGVLTPREQTSLVIHLWVQLF